MSLSFRLHNSLRPLRRGGDRRQPPQPASRPEGLWWGFGRGWLDFLERQQPEGPGTGRYNYRVELAEEANLLRLESWEEILSFSLVYGMRQNDQNPALFSPVVPEIMLGSRDLRENHLLRIGAISWERVAREYDGVEVVNYQRGRSRIYRDEKTEVRPFVQWLDLGWEISSGCIWKASAIQSLDPVILPARVLEIDAR